MCTVLTGMLPAQLGATGLAATFTGNLHPRRLPMEHRTYRCDVLQRVILRLKQTRRTGRYSWSSRKLELDFAKTCARTLCARLHARPALRTGSYKLQLVSSVFTCSAHRRGNARVCCGRCDMGAQWGCFLASLASSLALVGTRNSCQKHSMLLQMLSRIHARLVGPWRRAIDARRFVGVPRGHRVRGHQVRCHLQVLSCAACAEWPCTRGPSTQLCIAMACHMPCMRRCICARCACGRNGASGLVLSARPPYNA